MSMKRIERLIQGVCDCSLLLTIKYLTQIFTNEARSLGNYNNDVVVNNKDGALMNTNSPMTPGVVCAAFSVELYLKLLNLLVSGRSSRGKQP